MYAKGYNAFPFSHIYHLFVLVFILTYIDTQLYRQPTYRLSGYRFRDSQFYIKEETSSYLYTFVPAHILWFKRRYTPSIPPPWQMACHFKLHLKESSPTTSYHEDMLRLLQCIHNIPKSLLQGWNVHAAYCGDDDDDVCRLQQQVTVIISGEQCLVTRIKALEVQQIILQYIREYNIPIVDRHAHWSTSNPYPATLLHRIYCQGKTQMT
jgi:hypothetical protein